MTKELMNLHKYAGWSMPLLFPKWSEAMLPFNSNYHNIWWGERGGSIVDPV